MKKVLITGANKGIGLETARQLLAKGYHIYLGCRNLKNGLATADQLKAEGFSAVEALQIDVSNPDSVELARAEMDKRTESLDMLINNAGISGGWPQSSETALSVYREVYDTNLFGPVLVIQSFLDLLKRSPEPRIVNVSSSLSSMTLHNDPTWKFYQAKGAAYNSSKAALNMYTIHLAYDLRETPFKVNLVDPGYTATEFNNYTGTDTVEVAAARVVKVALIDADGPTGQFFSEDTNPETGFIPW